MSKTDSYSQAAKSLGKTFYIVLAVLTVAVLAMVIIYINYKETFALVGMIVGFVLYVAWLVVYGLINNRRANKYARDYNDFFTLLSENGETLFLSCYCSVDKLSVAEGKKKKFYIEVYSERNGATIAAYCKANPEGGTTSESGEQKSFLASFSFPYTVLEHISGVNVVLEKAVYNALAASPLYKNFLAQNTFFPIEFE